MIKKIDLHVHSRYSVDSQNTIIKTFNSAESYIEPVDIYQTAKKHGMDYVTITDHDTIDGCLLLKDKYPDDVLIGVETTAFFPEDGCSVHILLYGFSESQFKIIDEIRTNIYDLRQYIYNENIVASVSHPLYDIDNKLTLDHFEKLVLLFDVFEGLNGVNTERFNGKVTQILSSLTVSDIKRLQDKHQIEPYSSEPWIKSFTGGTDDHVGFFAGKTYTEVAAETVDDIPQAIVKRQTTPGGTSRSYKGYAFHLYKGFHDYLKNMGNTEKDNFLMQVSDYIFNGKRFNFKNKLKVHGLKASKKMTRRVIADLIEVADRKDLTLDEKLEKIYYCLTLISDELVKGFFIKLKDITEGGSLVDVIQGIPSLLTGLLMYAPFLFSMKYMHKDDTLLKQAEEKFLKGTKKKRKRILWFTDTINDLNGVSVTLRSIGWRAYKKGEKLKLVSSIGQNEEMNNLPPNVELLPSLYDFKVPYYDTLSIKVPSFFKMLEKIYDFNPDEIYISSPVTVGLYGLVLSKIMNVTCTAIYHTDFTMQAKNIIGEDSFLVDVIEKYTKWFHEKADAILVPTKDYIDVLMKRGFPKAKLGVFKRGIDASNFTPKERDGRAYLLDKLSLHGTVNLVYAGRISKDKNIDFMVDAFKTIITSKPDVNLIFVGDGPYLQELKDKYADISQIYYTGHIPNNMLPLVYSGSDLLVFPSETDTFGMVVLEAQACGLPALVSNIGGPKGVIQNGATGYVLETSSTALWSDKLFELIDWVENKDERYAKMRSNAREYVINNFDANRVLEYYFMY